MKVDLENASIRILEKLKSLEKTGKSASAWVIGEELGLSRVTISNILQQLTVKGLIEFTNIGTDMISITNLGILKLEEIRSPQDAKRDSLHISGSASTLLDGSILAPIVKEDNGTGTMVTSNMVIRTDRKWQIDVNWEVHGSLLDPTIPSSFPFTGKFIVRAFLESIGPGTEFELPESGGGVKINVEAPVTTSGYQRDYTATIPVAANAVDPGIYKLVVAITHESTSGEPGPIAGFFESGMLQIYDPK